MSVVKATALQGTAARWNTHKHILWPVSLIVWCLQYNTQLVCLSCVKALSLLYLIKIKVKEVRRFKYWKGEWGKLFTLNANLLICFQPIIVYVVSVSKFQHMELLSLISPVNLWCCLSLSWNRIPYRNKLFHQPQGKCTLVKHCTILWTQDQSHNGFKVYPGETGYKAGIQPGWDRSSRGITHTHSHLGEI